MTDQPTTSPTPQPGSTPDQTTDDLVLARALHAVGRARALGLHFYGHFIGIGGSLAVDGRSEVWTDGEPEGAGAPGVSTTALATVADLAVGAAIRSHLDPGCRLGTVTLSIRHPQVSIHGPIIARGEAEPGDGDLNPGRCLLSTPDGTIVGNAQAWFAWLPPPPGRVLSLMPWEYTDPPPYVVPALADLDEQEAAAVAAARAAGARASRRGTSISDELLNFDWRSAIEGCSSGELANGPELGNRVGHIQGGALYGAAALVAARALNVPAAIVIEGHYQFVRPADGALVHGEGTVLRRGRSAAFVEARLAVDGKLVGAGLFSFRMPADK
jgi:acyl-coenzyme A thioesterase PaaI-like protein